MMQLNKFLSLLHTVLRSLRSPTFLLSASHRSEATQLATPHAPRLIYIASMDPPSMPSLGPETWTFPMVGGQPGLGPPIRRPGGRASTGVSMDNAKSAGSVKGRRKRKDLASSEDDSSKFVSTSDGHDLMDHEAKRPNGVSAEENGNAKTEVEASSGMCDKINDENPQPAEPPKQDYIHVRARRGQATDNHSLAERARREKISERMKILQDLVPGCNKVIGKACILDEIINYIQALQSQVEFLSLKLEAVTTSMNSGFEVVTVKDFGAQGHDTVSSLTFTPHDTREYEQSSATDWLHMQIGAAVERVT
ncbi:transcription factor BHLH089-like isoform X2 [Zingiber officinale]|uniref:BHLH domain-containing protein n=1 Tax=Zingiber officinale TaxID=94328 RepID=A0A8J5LYQ4_ZINOF|nr:transcription factor BHLH089-like isoform X2 [Zingiber officinale]KAG6536701.1 hypothetical protein ZIOFF_001761 [Zingiber officinale]